MITGFHSTMLMTALLSGAFFCSKTGVLGGLLSLVLSGDPTILIYFFVILLPGSDSVDSGVVSAVYSNSFFEAFFLRVDQSTCLTG